MPMFVKRMPALGPRPRFLCAPMMPCGVQLVAGLRVGCSCWFVLLLTRCNTATCNRPCRKHTHTYTHSFTHTHTQTHREEQLLKCNQAETFVDALAEMWKTLPDPFMAFAILNFCKFQCPSWQVAIPLLHLRCSLPLSMADVDKAQHLMQLSCHSQFSFISAHFESYSLKKQLFKVKQK